MKYLRSSNEILVLIEQELSRVISVNLVSDLIKKRTDHVHKYPD